MIKIKQTGRKLYVQSFVLQFFNHLFQFLVYLIICFLLKDKFSDISRLIFGGAGVVIFSYYNDYRFKKNRYVNFGEEYINFSSVVIYSSKRPRVGSANIAYKDIRKIRTAKFPLSRKSRVYISANNFNGELLITRYFKNYKEMYSTLFSLVKKENPDVKIDDSLLKYVDGVNL